MDSKVQPINISFFMSFYSFSLLEKKRERNRIFVYPKRFVQDIFHHINAPRRYKIPLDGLKAVISLIPGPILYIRIHTNE